MLLAYTVRSMSTDYRINLTSAGYHYQLDLVETASEEGDIILNDQIDCSSEMYRGGF